MEETINLTDIIFNSLNELFSKLFSSIDNSIYSLLDDITFITPDLLINNSFNKIIGTSSNNGILLICNSLVFGFILYYSINYLISHLTYSRIDSPKQFIFKSIIFIAIMNSSLWICEQIINLISIITDGFSYLCYTLFNSNLIFSEFIDDINQALSLSGDFNLFSFDGIVKSFTSIGLINLIFNNSLRYIMVQIFVLISPFAFLSLITNSSEWFFRVWLKNFISLLLVQILTALVLLLSFSISPSSDPLFSKLLYIGIIFALNKVNHYMKELFGGISTVVRSSLSGIS